MMPDMDGLELCSRIRGRKGSGYIYFIIVTGKARKQVVIAKTLARQLKIPYGRLENKKIAREVIDLVSSQLADGHPYQKNRKLPPCRHGRSPGSGCSE
jgi:CheY-like chemotaxis protein